MNRQMRRSSRTFSNATFASLSVFLTLWVGHHFVGHPHAFFVAQTILLAIAVGCLVISRWLARQ
jgi:hypothetical protein